MSLRPNLRRFLKPAALVGALALAVFAFAGAGVPGLARAQGNPDVQVFTSDLTPLNAFVDGQGPVSGQAKIFVRGDNITVMVHARGLSAGPHAMHIHTGDMCPPAGADTTHDGLIDVVEGVPFYGLILVPLDSDLNSQGAGAFPSANAGGALNYMATGSLSAMLADLHAADPNPGDAVAKLSPGEALNLAMRHIIIHGVAADTPLPATVQTLPGAPATATLPVACGQITQTK
jgi:hypothetical protein